MDRLRAMHMFMAVARAGSLSAAARQLGEPLTTVSRLLGQLEAHVGTSLVTRTTRHMALTDAGRAYLETCRRIFEELNAVESQLAGSADGLSGEISVTAPAVFGRLHLLPIACAFLAHHPEVDLRLQLLDRVVDLVEEGADLALRIGALPDSSLVATRVGTLRLVTCAAPGYLRSFGLPTNPSALVGHDCISFSNFGGGPGRWMFKSGRCGRHVVRPRIRLQVNSAEAAIDAAISGLGITRVLDYQAEGALKRRKLRTVLEDFDDTTIPVHLVQRPVRLPKPQVRHFAAFVAKALRARLGSPGVPP